MSSREGAVDADLKAPPLPLSPTGHVAPLLKSQAQGSLRNDLQIRGSVATPALVCIMKNERPIQVMSK